VPSDTIYTHLVNSNVKKIAVSSMKNLSGVNYIRYIEIPVMIGYQLQFNKLSVMIRTGIGFGRFSKQSNYYINSTETDLVAKQDNDFRKMMYNYLLRVGVSYMITPQFGINFEPMFRSNLSSVFNNANEFQQRFKNVGANMGVTYSFK
jgi:opacity protein-like surface antigen